MNVAGTKELDFLWNPLSNFSMMYEPSYYRVTEVDGMRPDLISYNVYGTVQYWWIVCAANDIINPLIDIEVGAVLLIPNKLDITRFQRKYRVRRSR
jgi:hypothetical protein